MSTTRNLVRRGLLALTIIAGFTAGSNSLVRADAPFHGHQIAHAGTRDLVATMVRLHQFGAHHHLGRRSERVTGNYRLESVSAAVHSASALQIAWSSWPANATKEKSATLTGRDADNPDKNLFANGNLFHRQAYATHGLVSGYDQNAQLDFGQQDSSVDAEWFGSYYGTSQEAAGRVDDAVTNLGYLGIKGQSCYLHDQANCRLFIYPFGIGADQFVEVIYAVWSSDNAVGELAFLSGPGGLGPNAGELGSDMQTLLKAGNSTLISAGGTTNPGPAADAPPASPTITVDKFSLMRNVRGHLKQAKLLHLDETGFFISFFHVSALGTFAADGTLVMYYPKARFQILQGNQSLFSGPADISVAPDGRFLFDTDGNFTDPTALGELTAQYKLNVGDASATQSLAFTLGDALPSSF